MERDNSRNYLPKSNPINCYTIYQIKVQDKSKKYEICTKNETNNTKNYNNSFSH